jgi:hypothetical protein
MTQSSKKTTAHMSVSEKEAAVDLFLNRGDRTAKSVAAEVGISEQMLYNYAARVKAGESLETRRPGPPPKNKAHVERARKAKAKESPGSSIVIAKANNSPKQIALDIPLHPPTQARDLFVENALLRDEVSRLKRALQAALLS